ncbi:MAG TPA: hypothetical protein VHU87_12300 [Rhizomicrobium sp.]|jgi:hypothetical protein|nr:hypothetical protein [Rhizomicrobium sp.]
MSVTDWLELILLAGLAGAVGQCARIIVGIKKVNDMASATNQPIGDLFQLSRLVISLLIGFVAGVLAVLVMSPNIHAITASTIMALAAAGYTGADFIEGIMSRYEPAPANAPQQPAPQSGKQYAG